MGTLKHLSMKTNQPLISIVIANYNYGRFLEEAIQSVLRQCDNDMQLPTGDRIELIIVDGGSTDNSVEIIQSFSDRLGGIRFSEAEMASSKVLEHGAESVQPFDSRTSELQNFRTCFLWCSEPDRGQSDAFNKGFSRATGKFLTWLNADDVLFPGALCRAKESVLKNPNCEWFAGGCFWLDPELRVIKCSGARHFSRLRAKRGEISVWAPASFFTKELLDRVGGVDVDFHYMMDTELWFRFYRQAGVTYQPIKGYYWGLRLHPEAKMSGHNFESSEQAHQSHSKWAQIKREREIFCSRYGLSSSSRLTRWVTTPPWLYLKNKYDTWRFRGRHYSECF